MAASNPASLHRSDSPGMHKKKEWIIWLFRCVPTEQMINYMYKKKWKILQAFYVVAYTCMPINVKIN